MSENDEILSGLREDKKVNTLQMCLEEMERYREDPDSVLSLNGMVSFEEKTTERMEEIEPIVVEQRKSLLELREKHTEQLEIIRGLSRLIKALMDMSSGSDVSVGVEMIGSIDLNAVQNECNTNFLQDERLQGLMKARDKERFEVEFQKMRLSEK